MKKWQSKFISLTGSTDLATAMAKENESGWHFATLIPTQFDMKMMLERELDEDVDGAAFVAQLLNENVAPKQKSLLEL